MQYNGKHLSLITEKVNQIKTGIFKSDINSELLLPNNIIQVLQVGSDGYIWFYTSCNGKYAKNVKKDFYAYLDFYQKTSGCKLSLSGPASIIEDVEDSFISISNYSKSVAESLVLIKMKILKAEYYEGNIMLQQDSWKNKIIHSISHLFFVNTPKMFDFGPI